MPTPDLVAEHAALLLEQAELRRLCIEEWEVMSQQTAEARQRRLLYIPVRLAAIERTESWKRRGDS